MTIQLTVPVTDDKPIRVFYRNWKNEKGYRNLRPVAFVYGTALPWHQQADWMLQAYDLDKDDDVLRYFTLNTMVSA